MEDQKLPKMQASPLQDTEFVEGAIQEDICHCWSYQNEVERDVELTSFRESELEFSCS